MAIIYTDTEIKQLIQERKTLISGGFLDFRPIHNRGHLRDQWILNADSGQAYRLILRRNLVNQFDFSAILAVQMPQSNQLFRLLRYSGNSHEHTNSIEDVTFKNFHIHQATKRYQNVGAREDAYAEPTTQYQNWHSAITCLVFDSNIEASVNPQQSLF